MSSNHILHPYELYDLRLSDLCKMLHGVASGRIELFEKFDGFRIGIIASGDKITFFRSNADIKQGGFSSDDFNGRFSSPVVDEEAMLASRALENGFNQRLFTVFDAKKLNAEVLSQRVKNVIHYDVKAIVLHGDVVLHQGHLVERCGVKGIEVDGWFITGPVQRYVDITTNERLNDIGLLFQRIAALPALHNMKTNDPSIAEFMVHRLAWWLETNGHGNRSTLDLAKRLLNHGDHVPSLLSIKKAYPASQHSALSQLVKSPTVAIRWARQPLEDVLVAFGDVLLKDQKSVFVTNGETEVARLNDVFTSVRADVVKDANLRSKHVRVANDHVTMNAIEGVVFTHNNVLVKLTGSFAPFNQAHGIRRHGR